MEWLAETQWLWWIAAALVLGLIEIASLDLVFSMLSLAALAAAGAAGLGQDITIQVLTFVAVSALLLAVLRPLALRKLKPAGEGERTNADALVGRTAVVLQEITDRAGLVKLTGETWTARTAAGSVLAVDETVQVLRIDGATAVVAPLPTVATEDPDPTDAGPNDADPADAGPADASPTDAGPDGSDAGTTRHTDNP